MSTPKTEKDKAKSLLVNLEKLIVSFSTNDADLLEESEKLEKKLFTLLRNPFVEESEFIMSYQKYFLIRMEKSKRDFERSKKKESEELILDKNDNLVVISKKRREDGEESFYHLRDTEKEEEEYLFLSYKDKETGKIKSDWVEVGEKESESDVEYDPATICGIMKTYKEKGELLEVSLYHNHPQPTAVLFSDADLFGYALMTENLKIAFPKQTFTFDFRVITIDGMFTLPPVGADVLEKFINSTVQVPFKSSPKSSSPMPALFVLLQKRGKEFADMLSEHGIQCTFQPRQLEKNPVK